MTELQFNHLILSVIGVAGILWFYAMPQSSQGWSQSRRSVVGIASGLVYVIQAASAFTSPGQRIPLQLFGFIGCVLGCLGAARTMSDGVLTLGRRAEPADGSSDSSTTSVGRQSAR